ncbi:hypothetical protein FLONG3_6281 [Fusarium longipes]|uniref:Uncharacterized protein n=1 Tax=Fusarium longipes TaxID=694270 RepID=A0A395SMH6_9HYPO|nr:hypothetical protein FLONG3_6281 [Fusarium longipes]
MPFESPPHTDLVTNPGSIAPRTSLSTSTPRAAAKVTLSRLEETRASFDCQINPCVEAGNEVENSLNSPAKEEAPLPGTLNPYHDGRIRTAVPSKLKGRAIGNQGNFSVLQMQVQKPEMTARDLAAKRTSERTAAAAKLASSQGYRHPKRIRSQPAITPPTSVPFVASFPQALSQLRSQLDPVVLPSPNPNSLLHVAIPPTNQDQPSKDQAAATANIVSNTNARLVDYAVAKPNGIHGTNMGRSCGPLVADTLPDCNIEQVDGPVTSLDPVQDTDAEIPGGSSTTADAHRTNTEHTSGIAEALGEGNIERAGQVAVALREANTGHISKPGSVPRPLPPSVVKAEQARILTLFRYTQPRFIVDQLVEGVVHFGTIPDAPPTDTNLFTQSASNNGPGDLLISWLAEIFPAIPLESHKMKKPPTGRPRGRPKGSVVFYNKPTAAVRNTSPTFVPHPPEPQQTTSTQLTTIRDGPSKPKQAIADIQRPNVLLSPVSVPQNPTTTTAPTLPRHEDMPLQPVTNLSSRVVAIPRMRQIFPSTAPAVQGPASELTPVQRKKPTGRPRGRPPGSKNKLKSIPNMQSKKDGQQNLRPDHSISSLPQSRTWIKDAEQSRVADLTSSWDSAGSGCDIIPPQQPNSGPLDAVSTRVCQAVTSIAQTDVSGSLGGVEEARTVVGAEIPDIDYGLSLRAISDRDGVRSDVSKKRRPSRQVSPREHPVTNMLQASNPTTQPASSFVRIERTKRRRLSQEINQRALQIVETVQN